MIVIMIYIHGVYKIYKGVISLESYSIHEYQEAMAKLLLLRFLKIKVPVCYNVTMETNNTKTT